MFVVNCRTIEKADRPLRGIFISPFVVSFTETPPRVQQIPRGQYQNVSLVKCAPPRCERIATERKIRGASRPRSRRARSSPKRRPQVAVLPLPRCGFAGSAAGEEAYFGASGI